MKINTSTSVASLLLLSLTSGIVFASESTDTQFDVENVVSILNDHTEGLNELATIIYGDPNDDRMGITEAITDLDERVEILEDDNKFILGELVPNLDRKYHKALVKKQKSIDENKQSADELKDAVRWAAGEITTLQDYSDESRAKIENNETAIEELKDVSRWAAGEITTLQDYSDESRAKIENNETAIEELKDVSRWAAGEITTLQDYADESRAKIEANEKNIASKANATDLANKADKSELAAKANVADLVNKANKSELANKANVADLAAKADKSDLASKADKSELLSKAEKAELEQLTSVVAQLGLDMNLKADNADLAQKADSSDLIQKADKAEVSRIGVKADANAKDIATLKGAKLDKQEFAMLNTEFQSLKPEFKSLQSTVGKLSTQVDANTARLSQLDNLVTGLHKEMKSGLASQAALSGLFQPYNVGKVNVTAAVGGYKSSTALAVGAGYRFNENFATKAGVALSTQGGNLSYNVGVNYEF